MSHSASADGLSVKNDAQLDSCTQPPAMIARISSATPISVVSTTLPGRSTRR